jgi:hypothetical protein
VCPFEGNRCFQKMLLVGTTTEHTGFTFPQLICINCFRCYFIVAPKLIRPATLYGVTITILDSSRMDYPFISVRIEIKKDKMEITSVTQDIPVSSTQTLFMQVRDDNRYYL